MANPQYVYESISEFEIVEYLAAGGESIVFKGIKKSVGRTYALKFQPVWRYDTFEEYILHFYQELERSSVSRIAGLIPSVPLDDMRRIFGFIPQGVLSKLPFRVDEGYFCIVEDFIQGCNLREYCHGNAQKGLVPHCPPKGAPYSDVLDYQKTIFSWIVQFCDIMSTITDEKGVIHLDIKPENIMITDDTKSLILVDFGAAMDLEENKKYNLNEFIFSPEVPDNQKIDNVGTPYFAAPEAYHPAASDKPYIGQSMYGYVDQRSDIFSFGATLWDCLIPSPAVRSKLQYDQYYERDLFAAPSGYSPELEKIIVKCTQKEPVDRYPDFKSLKEAALEAEKKLPSSYKTKKTRHSLIIVASVMFALGLVFLFLNVRASRLTVRIAEAKIASLENIDQNLSAYQSAAEELLTAKADRESYEKLLYAACHQDGKEVPITDAGASFLMSCLRYTNNTEIIKLYVDTIIQKVQIGHDPSVCETVANDARLKSLEQSAGWDSRNLADARITLKDTSLEKQNDSNLLATYNTMKKVYDNPSAKDLYKTVLYAIAHRIDSVTQVKGRIAELVGISESQLQKQLNEIMKNYEKTEGGKKNGVA